MGVSQRIDKDSIRVSGGQGSSAVTILEVGFSAEASRTVVPGDRIGDLLK